MPVGSREVYLLASEIRGDELAIRMIVDKYKIGKRDRNAIIEKIEKIERNTIKLVKLKEEYDAYNQRRGNSDN